MLIQSVRKYDTRRGLQAVAMVVELQTRICACRRLLEVAVEEPLHQENLQAVTMVVELQM